MPAKLRASGQNCENFRSLPRLRKFCPQALRKEKVGKLVYWFMKAGGNTYFGNLVAVPYQEARKLFSDPIQTLVGEDSTSKGKHGGAVPFLRGGRGGSMEGYKARP